MAVDVNATGQATQHRDLETLSERIKTHLAKIYRALGLTDPVVSVLFTDDEQIRTLNERWRSIDEATDVLSFPAHSPDALPDEPDHLGDIVISLPCAQRLVESQDHRDRVAEELDVDPSTLTWSLTDEVSFLFVHGLLHLVGYDHGDPEEEAEMRDMERQIWQLMNP